MFIGSMTPVSFAITASAPSAAAPASVPASTTNFPTFHNVEAVDPITDGENQVPSGASGTVLGVSLDEVEVQFYSPKDVLAFAQESDVQSS